jgi:hypothetical protein
VSEFTALRAVSFTLRALLEEHITNSTEPQLSGVPIDLRSPKELRVAQVNGVSLWLYRVARDGDLLNRPATRPSPNQVGHTQLPVSLSYLVTPLAEEPADEQVLLGRVLQVFNDHAILRGADLQKSPQVQPLELRDEIRVSLEMLSLEEITRVWDSLQEPYELSVAYRVQVVSIESDHEPIETSPVLVRENQYTQIVSVT